MAMMQGSNKPKKEGKPMGGPPVEMMTPEVLAPPTGIEGREADVAESMQVLVRTMQIQIPYPHDMNDALLKAHLNAVQFAKDNGMLDKYIEHDRETMQPLLERTKNMRSEEHPSDWSSDARSSAPIFFLRSNSGCMVFLSCSMY